MEQAIIGLVEEVEIHGPKGQKAVQARIDTGARSNSIDATLAKELGVIPSIETVVVKSASGTSVRPITKLAITLAGHKLEGRFTVADRKNLKYPLLIGRNILKNGFLIDPSKEP